jgi:hypothetical protein
LLVIVTGNTLAADNALPPEVQKLIGMKIPPKVMGKSGGDIPNFILFSGGMLNKKIGNETPRANLIYEEGLVAEKWPVFVVYASHADKTRDILDAQLLPNKLINWRYANGKIKRLENGDRLIFSIDCQYENGDGRIIFGLEDPKVEREGMSTRIERAWEVDPQSGHIKSISTQNISCAILGE